MPILNLNYRPHILFDASNREHRQIYYQFKKRNGDWGKAPYRFVVDDATTNLIDYLDRKVSVWYLNNEFDSAKSKK